MAKVGARTARCILDSGAEVSVVKEDLVRKDQLTGENITVSGVNGDDKTLSVAILWCHVADISFSLKAAVAPRTFMNDEVLLGANLGKALFRRLMDVADLTPEVAAVRLTRAQEEKVRSDEEATADARRQELSTIKNPEEVISVVEGDENLDDEVVDSSLVWERTRGRVDGEQEGMSLNTEHEHAREDECAEEERELSELEVLQVPLVNEGGTLKKDYLEWMEKDESLEQMKKAADQNVEGYSWVEGILKREVTDELNQPRQIVVVSKGLRRRLLKMAHDEAGHLSVRKVMFYYVNLTCGPE